MQRTLGCIVLLLMVGALTILGCDTSSNDGSVAEAQDLQLKTFSFFILIEQPPMGFAEFLAGLFGLPSGVNGFTLAFGEAIGDTLNVVLEAEDEDTTTHTGRVRVSGGICAFDFDPAEGENQPQDRTYSCRLLMPRPFFPTDGLALTDDQASDATGRGIMGRE